MFSVNLAFTRLYSGRLLWATTLSYQWVRAYWVYNCQGLSIYWQQGKKIFRLDLIATSPLHFSSSINTSQLGESKKLESLNDAVLQQNWHWRLSLEGADKFQWSDAEVSTVYGLDGSFHCELAWTGLIFNEDWARLSVCERLFLNSINWVPVVLVRGMW